MVWNPGGRGLTVCQRWASLKCTRIWRPTASCCRKSSCAGGRRASPGRNRGKIPLLFSLIRAHYAHGTLQDCRWLNGNPSYLALFRKDSSHSRTQLIYFCLLKTQYSTSCGVELLHLTVVGIGLSAPAPGSRPAIATIRRGNQLQHAQGGTCKRPKSGLEIQSRASECFLKPSGDFFCSLAAEAKRAARRESEEEFSAFNLPGFLMNFRARKKKKGTQGLLILEKYCLLYVVTGGAKPRNAGKSDVKTKRGLDTRNELGFPRCFGVNIRCHSFQYIPLLQECREGCRMKRCKGSAVGSWWSCTDVHLASNTLDEPRGFVK